MSEQAFRLRKDLDQPVLPPEWPPGFSCRTLRAEDARAVHAVMSEAYGEGRGVPGFHVWWPEFSGDSEFDASLCFLVYRGEKLVAVALCWTSAFLKDLAVRPDARRVGLGGNLLRQVFRTFQARHARTVDLKVEAGNKAAIALYERAGMYRVPWEG
ncbi:GNAT family N-acetyltransferase [Mesorhizobium sp. ZMM04-5]|uniref:GNAT family N-acetyltransferase n=1 Tax=Mesorhizobium marinum TaxID=3228790 RepID=A0ABV3R1S2_9HYPH